MNIEQVRVAATTASGRVSGVDEGAVVVFRGIPFADAPVGARRFAPPAPAPAWEVELDCSAFRSMCPQIVRPYMGGPFDGLRVDGPMDEDCLFLNVWTPTLDGCRPVMVWLHGGAYMFGSGSGYDGTAFAREGVVLVTVNYRLHGLGLLYLDELFDGARGTGNLAILDQIAALSWVRDNIANFGGDPSNVTVFGASAGGLSIGALMGTPAARGLFRRAILQSGACHFSVSTAAATRVARRMLELVDVRPGDWRSLREVPTDRIAQAAIQITAFELADVMEEESAAQMCFGPVSDGVTRPGSHWDLVKQGNAAGVDVLIGTTADEWCRFQAPPAVPDPPIEQLFGGSGQDGSAALEIYAAHRPGATPRDLKFAAMTDWFFRIPAVRLAERQREYARNVWMYRFSWRSPALDGVLGACHGIDVPFLFGNLDAAAGLVGNDPPLDLACEMREAWVRFAASGNPNGGRLPPWPPYDLKDRAVMDFGNSCQVLFDPQSEERVLWEGIR